MTLAALAFAAGAAALQLQAELPPLAWVALLPVFLALAFKWRLSMFAVGFLWAALAAHLRMADWLAPALEGRDLDVVGVVASLPAVSERAVRFEFEVESSAPRLPKKLLLSWHRSPWTEEGPALLADAVHPGERWFFTVRLRRPHGHVNPHGFDYEAWLLERGIGATGYVRQRGVQTRLGLRNHPLDFVERTREAVRERFVARLGATPAAGILAALAVGDQRAIAAEEWRLFNRTGVTHLMSISGLHVTLVSGLAAWLMAFGWRRVPAATLRLPARKAAAAAAIAAALGYALLAGFALDSRPIGPGVIDEVARDFDLAGTAPREGHAPAEPGRRPIAAPRPVPRRAEPPAGAQAPPPLWPRPARSEDSRPAPPRPVGPAERRTSDPEASEPEGQSSGTADRARPLFSEFGGRRRWFSL